MLNSMALYSAARKWGSDFDEKLMGALLVADERSARLIRSTWPDIIEKLTTMDAIWREQIASDQEDDYEDEEL